MNSAEFLDAYPSLQETLLNSKFLDIIPGGFSVATDVSCETIVHNPVTAKFLRIEPWEKFSYSTSEQPPAKVYHNGKPIAAEYLPMQRAAWNGEVVERFELEFIWEDGVYKIAQSSACPLHDKDGNICGAISTMVDVTEMVTMEREVDRQKAQLEQIVEDLQESNELFHTTIENMMDCVSICTAVRNIDGQIVDFVVDYVNQAACNNSQKIKEDLNYHSLLTFSPEVIESGFFEEYCKVIETGKPFCGESIYYSNSNNKYVEGAYEHRTFKLGDGVVVTYRNITQRKRDEISTLELSEERFYNVFRSSPNVMAIIRDADRVYIDVNEFYEETTQLKREDIIGKNIYDIIERTEVQNLISEELKRFGEIRNMEVKFHKNRIHLLSAVPIILNGEKCFLFSHNDITELKKSQEEISRLDRLNLVGQMAAGIGHEIRNPMTTVRGYLQLLAVKQEYVSQKATFELMISELDRANSIITEFLSLTRNQPTKLKCQNLNDLLNNLYPMLEANAYNQDKLIEFIPGEIPDIQLNTKEIHQLVLNLCHNGLEAMKEQTCLTIRTFSDSEKVVLSVQDEGCGIEIEDVAKLGTPFFTTKECGTGLGLTMCYSIAASHNASIDVDTGPQGTTFFVRFSPFPAGDFENVLM